MEERIRRIIEEKLPSPKWMEKITLYPQRGHRKACRKEYDPALYRRCRDAGLSTGPIFLGQAPRVHGHITVSQPSPDGHRQTADLRKRCWPVLPVSITPAPSPVQSSKMPMLPVRSISKAGPCEPSHRCSWPALWAWILSLPALSSEAPWRKENRESFKLMENPFSGEDKSAFTRDSTGCHTRPWCGGRPERQHDSDLSTVRRCIWGLGCQERRYRQRWKKSFQPTISANTLIWCVFPPIRCWLFVKHLSAPIPWV